jgi:hypothetical protein
VNAAAALGAREELSPAVVDQVRRSVRGVLQEAPAYADASAEKRRALANRMVDLGLVAAGLIDEDRRLTERVARRSRPSAMAAAQSAGDQLGLQATRAAAGTITAVRDAIDFPTYVGSLITGVFQAILTSSTQQVGAIGDLVDNVASSAEDFAASVGTGEVTAWLVAKFPQLLVGSEDGVRPRPGVDLAEHADQLRAALGGDGDPTDPESLMDLGRRAMARNKQQVLGTMMQMGLQRIVVDEGRIHASMDLRVDANSGSQEAKGARDDWRVNAGASGTFGNGIWGASASASTSIGQVKSDAQLTTEQIGLRAGLRSSVDLTFRTDQVPLDRFADEHARVKLASAARVPADVSGATPQSILTGAPGNVTAPSLAEPQPVPAPPAPPAVTGRRTDAIAAAPAGAAAGAPAGAAAGTPAGAAAGAPAPGKGAAVTPAPSG